MPICTRSAKVAPVRAEKKLDFFQFHFFLGKNSDFQGIFAKNS